MEWVAWLALLAAIETTEETGSLIGEPVSVAAAEVRGWPFGARGDQAIGRGM